MNKSFSSLVSALLRTMAAAVLCGACGQGAHSAGARPGGARTAAASAGSRTLGRSGQLVDIGDRSLFLECAGEGSPVVVFEAGGGSDGTAWKRVVPRLLRSTKTCVYDRAGTGLSSVAPRPHTIQQMVDEFDKLLSGAHLAGRTILVGHSLGGLLVRLYASQHPNTVSGMVLVDPTTEEQDARMWSLMPSALMDEFKQSLQQSREGLDYDSFVSGMAMLRGSDRSLGNVPLVVLTAVRATEGGARVIPDELGKQLAREWVSMHEEVSRRSSNGAHILLEASGHDIPHDAPQVIVAAVEAVLASARTRRPLAADRIRAAARDTSPSRDMSQL